MRSLVIFFITVVVLPSCKKKEIVIEEEQLTTTDVTMGLPSDIKKLNGYLYATYNKNANASNSSPYFYAYSTFSEPARNLTMGFNHYNDQGIFQSASFYGNIDVGKVTSNEVILSKSTFSPNLTYQGGRSTYSLNTKAVIWTIEGNRSFRPTNDLSPVRSFPTVSMPTPTISSIKRSEEYTLNLEGVATDYDSLVVIIYDQNSSFGEAVRKPVGKNEKAVTFKPSDFSKFFTGPVYGTLWIYAMNYAYRTVDNRIYLFEQANKISATVYLEP